MVGEALLQDLGFLLLLFVCGGPFCRTLGEGPFCRTYCVCGWVGGGWVGPVVFIIISIW